MRTFFKWIVGLLLLLLVVGFAGFLMFNEKLPEAEFGAEAEVLADKMLEATNKAAWDTTSVISWTFAGRHQFKWNKAKDSVVVMWGDNLVRLHTKTITGTAFVSGKRVGGEEENDLIQTAWSHFCNDSFWLAAPYKIRDPGTSRGIVKLPSGEEALLISYENGGVTPGDKYLWILDENGLPTAWKMWTQIIPIGGVEATWENYKTLPSGAVVAQTHKLPVFNLELSDIIEY